MEDPQQHRVCFVGRGVSESSDGHQTQRPCGKCGGACLLGVVSKAARFADLKVNLETMEMFR